MKWMQPTNVYSTNRNMDVRIFKAQDGWTSSDTTGSTSGLNMYPSKPFSFF